MILLVEMRYLEMHKNQKLDIRVTKTLKTEQNTLRILLATCITAVIFSILLEYIGKFLICNQTQQVIHIDYLINIMLGLSASAFISFVSLVFPYLHRKNEKIIEIKTRMKHIIYLYFDILFSVYSVSQEKDVISKDFHYEKMMIDDINNLKKEIDELIVACKNSEIASDKINRIISTLNREIKNNLSTISVFCSYLFLFNLTTDPDDDMLDIVSEIEKSTDIKEAEIACYKFLYKTIEQNFSFHKLTDLYETLFDKEEIIQYDPQTLNFEYNKYTESTLNAIIRSGTRNIIRSQPYQENETET